MMPIEQLLWARSAGIAGIGLGAAAVGTASTDPDFIVRRLWQQYVDYLDQELRLQFLTTPAVAIPIAQLVIIGGLLVGMVVSPVPDLALYILAFIGLTAILPVMHLQRERKRRVAKLELQVDTFLLAYSNSLKSVPNPGAALNAVAVVLQAPMSQEVDRALKEMKVGSSLEQALLSMAERVNSRTLASALSAILIGMQVGGDLPTVLATTAEALREMQRLDGVVRTKTAEGKAQLWVLALFPIAIIYLFNSVSPGYFEPLSQTLIGTIAAGAAAILWVGSIVLARKVLSVDV